jgi:hypothetical protein
MVSRDRSNSHHAALVAGVLLLISSNALFAGSRNERCSAALDAARQAHATLKRDMSAERQRAWSECEAPGVDRELVARAALLRVYAPNQDRGAVLAQLNGLEAELSKGKPSVTRVRLLEGIATVTGDSQRAVELLRQAALLRAELFGADSLEAARGRVQAALSEAAVGNKESARVEALAALGDLRRARGADDAGVLGLQAMLALRLKCFGFEEDAAILQAEYDKLTESRLAGSLRWTDRAAFD